MAKTIGCTVELQWLTGSLFDNSQNSHFLTNESEITLKPDLIGKLCGQIRFQRQKIHNIHLLSFLSKKVDIEK